MKWRGSWLRAVAAAVVAGRTSSVELPKLKKRVVARILHL